MEETTRGEEERAPRAICTMPRARAGVTKHQRDSSSWVRQEISRPLWNVGHQVTGKLRLNTPT